MFLSLQVKGGIAEADGRLIQGDQILEVNGQDLRTASQEHAAAVLKVSDILLLFSTTSLKKITLSIISVNHLLKKRRKENASLTML